MTKLRFKFSKLVRDKIVDNQIATGTSPTFHYLNKAEHVKELVSKIVEEAGEILDASGEELAAEIADVQQAVDDLIKIHGLKQSDINAAKKIKSGKSGNFRKGIFIDWVEVDSKDKWVDYFRKNADRYPEIKETDKK